MSKDFDEFLQQRKLQTDDLLKQFDNEEQIISPAGKIYTAEDKEILR